MTPLIGPPTTELPRIWPFLMLSTMAIFASCREEPSGRQGAAEWLEDGPGQLLLR